MLRYKSHDTSDGLQLRFTREASWVSPIATAILLIATWYFGVSIGHLADSSEEIEGAIGAFLGFALCGLTAMAAGFILASTLRRYRCLFSPTGITLTIVYLGVPVRTLTFERNEIHQFGWRGRSHGASPVLQFAASGQLYYLAHGVAENEVSEFVEMLSSRGIDYSNKSGPLQRKTSANTLLG